MAVERYEVLGRAESIHGDRSGVHQLRVIYPPLLGPAVDTATLSPRSANRFVNQRPENTLPATPTRLTTPTEPPTKKPGFWDRGLHRIGARLTKTARNEFFGNLSTKARAPESSPDRQGSSPAAEKHQESAARHTEAHGRSPGASTPLSANARETSSENISGASPTPREEAATERAPTRGACVE